MLLWTKETFLWLQGWFPLSHFWVALSGLLGVTPPSPSQSNAISMPSAIKKYNEKMSPRNQGGKKYENQTNFSFWRSWGLISVVCLSFHKLFLRLAIIADDVSFIIIFYIYKKSKQFGLKTKLRCARLALQFHAYGLFYSMDQAHISHLGPAP